MLLVYVKTLANPSQGRSGIAPEKWPELLRDMSGKPRPYLAKHELSAEQEHFDLASLTALYPPPILAEPSP